MENELLELHAIFRGRVQGVGFRWTLVDHAEKLGLKGTARNLQDGTVEVYAQGSKAHLEGFVHLVQQEPGFARIDSVSCKYQSVKTPYQTFGIV